MFTWKTHLLATLARLESSHGNSTLTEIEKILCATFDADRIRFLDCRGRGLPDSLTLSNLLADPFEVSIAVSGRSLPAENGQLASRFRADARHPESRPAESHPPQAPADGRAASRSEPPGGGPSQLVPGADARYDRFLHEFYRLEQRNGFMWAGYIVRELLPRLGFSADESKHVLDRLKNEGVFTITKVTNPKNPEFPATGVRLNCEHAIVKALVGEIEPEARPHPAEPVPAAHGQVPHEGAPACTNGSPPVQPGEHPLA